MRMFREVPSNFKDFVRKRSFDFERSDFSSVPDNEFWSGVSAVILHRSVNEDFPVSPDVYLKWRTPIHMIEYLVRNWGIGLSIHSGENLHHHYLPSSLFVGYKGVFRDIIHEIRLKWYKNGTKHNSFGYQGLHYRTLPISYDELWPNYAFSFCYLDGKLVTRTEQFFHEWLPWRRNPENSDFPDEWGYILLDLEMKYVPEDSFLDLIMSRF